MVKEREWSYVHLGFTIQTTKWMTTGIRIENWPLPTLQSVAAPVQPESTNPIFPARNFQVLFPIVPHRQAHLLERPVSLS